MNWSHFTSKMRSAGVHFVPIKKSILIRKGFCWIFYSDIPFWYIWKFYKLWEIFAFYTWVPLQWDFFGQLMHFSVNCRVESRENFEFLRALWEFFWRSFWFVRRQAKSKSQEIMVRRLLKNKRLMVCNIEVFRRVFASFLPI